MMMKTSRFGAGKLIAFVLLWLAGCETIQPAPPLKVSEGTITYVKVVPAPRPIGIGMTPLNMGLLGQTINDHTESQSKRFADLTGSDHALALQNELLMQVIARARQAGINLVDASQLGNRSLRDDEQLITLDSFCVLYMAPTIVNGYQPSAMAIIASSRDPAIPQGQHRYARSAQINIDDTRYRFASSDAILEKPDLASEGMNLAVDTLAQRIVEQFIEARKAAN